MSSKGLIKLVVDWQVWMHPTWANWSFQWK